GEALSWYTYLSPEVKKDWVKLEKAFSDYFAGGTSTVETELEELKWMKQGKLRMIQFSQKFRETARKANIGNDAMLISYLKAAVNPEMRRAIVYRGPSTYAHAVDICIEVENDILQNKSDNTVKVYTPSYTTSTEDPDVEMVQNYQQKRSHSSGRNGFYGYSGESRKCFSCGKKGHLKKNCWKNKNKQNTQHLADNEINPDMDNSDEDSESDVDIFGHFFSNNNQDSIESNKRRFKLNINCNGQNTLLLVDTGSTISSITSGAALRLKL
ncbi:hypothetical protein BD770DRAFT_303864, partial [Pilaira anomala]